MKRIISIIIAAMLLTVCRAQTADSAAVDISTFTSAVADLPVTYPERQRSVSAEAARQAFHDWDQEEEIVDMDLKPRIVTGGLILNANESNFIITDWKDENNGPQRFSSRMKVGVEIGGFMDFYVTKHFAIQPQLLFIAEENCFGERAKDDRLWSIGMDIPVYFMGRWGNRDKGYLSVGAGPFTHFTFASNLGEAYSHNEATSFAPKQAPLADGDDAPESSESTLGYDFSLHDNHSGLAAIISYEFPLGIQILATYKASLSDIVYFYNENPNTTFDIYPQRVSLGIAYRFK